MRKIFARISRRATAVTNSGLAALESRFYDTSDAPLPYPPIFIIGPPRSGSTLVYQSLVQSYRVAYLSNLHHHFCRGPSIVERLLRISERSAPSDFSADLGYVAGWKAPSECWNFWYQFFPRRPQFVTLQSADPKRLSQMRGAVRALICAAGKPLLIKNLPMLLRLGPVHRYLHEALFIVTSRELLNNARSILAARQKTFGSYSRWWSVEPPGFEQLQELPAHEQVVQQIHAIQRVINCGRKEIGCERFFDITYEDFCADTSATLRSLKTFLAHHGVRLRPRGEIPAYFPLSTAGQLPEPLEKQLRDFVNRTSQGTQCSAGDVKPVEPFSSSP